MDLSINPKHFTQAALWEEKRSITEAIDLVYEAGFRRFDLDANTREDAELMAAHLATLDAKVIQSHIPFNRYGKRDIPEVFHDKVMASAEYAKLLGSEILVVHGDEFPYDKMIYTASAALEYNYRFFHDLVDFAAKSGMRVAFENTFQEATILDRPHFGSAVEDLCALVDRFGTETVGVCWDTGHARVQYGARENEALLIAGERVICTHIHDNYYNQDLHGFPFTGNVDWKTFMTTLKKIGYQGDLSFEFVYDRLPRALAPDYMKILYKTGEYLLHLSDE